MLGRLREMQCFKNETLIAARTKELEEEWDKLQQFMMWSYSNQHVRIFDVDTAHCAAYALGGVCPHEHLVACAECVRLFTFFDTTVSSFLSDTVLQELNNHEFRPEIQTMIDAIPRLSSMVKHYTSHRMRAKVQFHEINKIKEQWLKGDSRRVLVVVDHKQKVLGMKYRESQVEYFGKKGMSLLGSMEVRWVENSDGTEGFTYSFVDYIIRGYAGQDHVQVCAVVQKTVHMLLEKSPNTTELCVQSDNATCFASQELIPFIYHLNAIPDLPKIKRWIFTEAQTGRGRLDTHFSYLNVVMKSYVEDGNDIDLEEDIFKAMSYHGEVARTTVVLLDARKLKGPVLSRSFKAKTGSCAMHESQFASMQVAIFTSSGITKPETINKTKLDKHTKNGLLISIEQQFTLPKPCLFVKSSVQGSVPIPCDVSTGTKATAYQGALEQAGIQSMSYEGITVENIKVATPPQLPKGWAQYPGNTGQRFGAEAMQRLNELYMIGKINKKRKVSADRALQILHDELVSNDWVQQLDITVPKIKAFFQLTPAKQIALIQKTLSVGEEDGDGEYQNRVEEVEHSDMHNELQNDASTLQDLDQ